MLRRRPLPIAFTELKTALRAADPSAVLAPASVLRRIIREDRDLPRLGMPVTHRKCYWIGRDALLQIADKWELGLDAGEDLAPVVILLIRPDLEELASRARDELLVECWRQLFHVRVHLALEQTLAGQGIEAIDARIDQIGRSEFHELRSFLRQDDRLLPPRDARATYIEFAACYFELRYFAPQRLNEVFPIAIDPDRFDPILAQDLDAPALLAATRLTGAPEPRSLEPAELPPRSPLPDDPQPLGTRPWLWQSRRLSHWADRASKLGNNVKAAVLRRWAARRAERQQVAAILTDVEREMAQLAERLQKALRLDDSAVKTLREILPRLVVPAAQGGWPVERRLLYDLQKVCIDHERNVYKVDLFSWLCSLGRTPLKRPLPNQREVLITKHLRSAQHRLAGARIAVADQQRLAALFDDAVHHSEEHLRSLFRPVLDESLGQVGLRAENLPERVARNKLIEELADKIIENGHLNMGNVRDALSRNRLKLKDLRSAQEFLQGDKLLLLNQQFTKTLDGIYHKGEIYLRWLQRLSSLAFATPVGRFFTRYIALPFGGAFMVLKFIEELAHLVGSHVHFGNALQIVSLGSFFLGLFYIEDFRAGVVRGLVAVYQVTRWLFVTAPRDAVRLQPVRAVIRSEPFQFFYRNAFKPLASALVVWIVLSLRGVSLVNTIQLGLAVFFLGTLWLNTPWGRRLDEVFSSKVARSWHRFHRSFIPGLIRGTMDFFHRVLDAINAGLYAVDEWLRFRHGEGRISLGFKAVLGAFWAAVTYLVRACVNLLVEPQINPIKHFPVVTVSHKLILPLIPVFGEQLHQAFGMDKAQAMFLVGSVIWLIPGIFGFLVWELKENWRLYEANRPAVLKRVMIGHHGESMVGLLRPGFHSGTIPKLRTRLRRAEQEGQRTGEWKNYRKRVEQLHHVEESVRHFVERELLALADKCRLLHPLRLKLATLELSDYRIALELTSVLPPVNGDGPDSFRIAFEEQNGWLVADILRHGWVNHLPDEQLQAFRTALAGLCKMAGVDLVRPQIRAVLGTREYGFDIVNRGLMIWPRGRSEVSAVYELWGGAELKPHTTLGADPYPFPRLPLNAIYFGAVPITWDQWLATWNEDPDGESSSHVHIEAVHVLPIQSNATAGASQIAALSGGWKREMG